MSLPETSTATVAVDRISNLPDDILVHILSFLPTKQAFLTSILSKRWKHLWCYVPNVELEFVDAEEAKHSLFDKFVYSVLVSLEAAGKQQKKAKIRFSQLCIHSFILHVEHRMHDWERMIPHLPYSILTCETLVVLKLSFLNMGEEFCYNAITLPSLKTLHLKVILFPRDDDLILLTDNCPNLEDLLLFDITYATFSAIVWAETLTKLKRADITDCDFYIPMETVSNAEFLRIKLFRWYYRGCDLPTFHNLTHLVLCYDWDIVTRMLHICPKLQNLDLFQHIEGSFWEDGYFGEYEHEKWSHPKSVPGCLSSNLKTCTMRDFAFPGLQSDHIVLAKFILKNSTVLETMSIWCVRKLSKIKRQLTSCSRASATCQLSINDRIYVYGAEENQEVSSVPRARNSKETCIIM